MDDSVNRAGSVNGDSEPLVRPIPPEAMAALDADAELAGGAWDGAGAYPDADGRTMFDSPSSVDHSVTVLVPRQRLARVPSQAIVRIESVEDQRTYLGVVVKGPFAEPDGLRADAPLVVTTTVRGALFIPNYHGRVQVQLLGERVDGALQPPRYRPLPSSPVYVVDEDEAAAVLGVDGDLRLGLAVGHEAVRVGIPSEKKSVLPRHTGIIGTTGGGKSTTVAGLVVQAQRAGFATVLLDVEGEYTYLGEPTDDPDMQVLLAKRDLKREGVSDLAIWHLVGRESANPEHPNRCAFSLRFCRLSPYMVAEILDLSDAQQLRYLQAYDVAVGLLRRFGLADRDQMEVDEFEEGFPGLTLDHLVDVVRLFEARFSDAEVQPRTPAFVQRLKEVQDAVRGVKTDSAVSWRALLGKLMRLRRLGVFDSPQARPLDYGTLLEPGRVSLIDLSDTDSPDLNNLVIADILRGLQGAQENGYEAAEAKGEMPPKTLVIVEEAHEFLARERIGKMPHLFAQVARIAKRGRKRWLGLVFVTQLPGHLPTELYGLINNWIVHKINDAEVIGSLRRSVTGVDDGLWDRLSSLAPGQAIVTFGHMQRPVLTAIDPTPAKLRMVD